MMTNIESAVKEVKEKLTEKEELLGSAEVCIYCHFIGTALLYRTLHFCFNSVQCHSRVIWLLVNSCREHFLFYRSSPLPTRLQAISVPVVAAHEKGFFESGRTLYFLLLIALLVACIPLLLFMPGMDVRQWLHD